MNPAAPPLQPPRSATPRTRRSRNNLAPATWAPAMPSQQTGWSRDCWRAPRPLEARPGHHFQKAGTFFSRRFSDLVRYGTTSTAARSTPGALHRYPRAGAGWSATRAFPDPNWQIPVHRPSACIPTPSRARAGLVPLGVRLVADLGTVRPGEPTASRSRVVRASAAARGMLAWPSAIAADGRMRSHLRVNASNGVHRHVRHPNHLGERFARAEPRRRWSGTRCRNVLLLAWVWPVVRRQQAVAKGKSACRATSSVAAYKKRTQWLVPGCCERAERLPGRPVADAGGSTAAPIAGCRQPARHPLIQA